MKRVLITGGAGFIGHHLVQHIIRNTDWEVFILDKLTYASKGLQRLREIRVLYDPLVHMFTWDITNPLSVGLRSEIGELDYIFHLAAESHVDRSIVDAEPFILSNVLGTTRMLDFARTQKKLEKLLYFNTDEVFGTAGINQAFKENDPYSPSNPYAASKAAASEICTAYHKTYGLPIIQSMCMNNFGERQDVEKFIPMCIKKILNDEEIIIHSYPGSDEAGSRFYIHARNSSSATIFLIEKGLPGERYNIRGELEVSNLEIAKKIAAIIGKQLKYKMVDFHSSRPGHDLRYSLSGAKMKKLGWKIPVGFDSGLEKTVIWTLNHPLWLEK